jgi:hypothetical protein
VNLKRIYVARFLLINSNFLLWDLHCPLFRIACLIGVSVGLLARDDHLRVVKCLVLLVGLILCSSCGLPNLVVYRFKRSNFNHLFDCKYCLKWISFVQLHWIRFCSLLQTNRLLILSFLGHLN